VRGATPIAAAMVVSAALGASYVAMGGASYQPADVRDPCDPRPWRSPEGVEESAEQFTLSALDGAACKLRVSRETLAVALASEKSREQFASDYGLSDGKVEEAARAGVRRAIDDAEEAGALGGLPATALRAVASQLPVDEAIALIQDARELFE
jgi:hypothetical protein